MKTNELKPRVYVGTYKKYNEGSLAGGWLTLTDFKDYAAFLEACHKLHKNEGDPEFMIQDTENFPDGLNCMEWLNEDDFNDVIKACKEEQEEEVQEQPKFEIIDYSEKAIAVMGDTRNIKDKLKDLGGRFNPRLTCGAGWIFPKTKREALEKLLQGGKVEKSAAKPKDDKGDVYKKNLEEYLKVNPDDYYRKNNVGAVKVEGSFVLIEKPSIENRFCFHDEGPDYEFYKTLMADEKKLRDYFLAKNLDGLDRSIEQMKDESVPYFLGYSNYSKSYYFYRRSYSWEKKQREDDKDMTPVQRAEIIKALEWSRAQFEKRLNTYLKRYGVSKIHTWTYWADR